MCKLLSFYLLTFMVIHQTKCQGKLHVEVLYESLCPDSLNFITEQLHPVFRELAPHISLKLTPFGKSVSRENGAQFVCQHGPQECKGNKIQSCVLGVLPDPIAQVEYVNCFIKVFKKSRKDEGEFGQQCSTGVGVESNQVDECYSSEVGTQLQLIAEQDTLKFRPRFVPTIVYNGVFDQQLQDQSLTDFRGVVCQLLGQSGTGACPQNI